MVTSSAPSRLALHRDIDGGIAAADDHDLAADRQRRLVRGLAQPRDIGDGVLDALPDPRPRPASALTPGKPDAEEHGIEVAAQLGQA